MQESCERGEIDLILIHVGAIRIACATPFCTMNASIYGMVYSLGSDSSVLLRLQESLLGPFAPRGGFSHR